MPWLEAKGLFPGRGMPGTAPGVAGEAGTAAAGTEAAGASGVLAATAGAAGAASAFGAEGVDGAEGAAGVGPGEGATDAASVVNSAGFAFAAGFDAGFASAGLALGKASRSFFATGGVMVEEPPLTYSPSSFSLASASLVSIPSSLAMS